MNAEDFVGGEPFAVLLADDIVRSDIPAVRQMTEVSESDYVIGCERVPLSEVYRYGAVVPDVWGTDVFRARKIVEKPQPPQETDIVVAGRYLLRNRVFDVLGAMEDGHTSLTDALAMELDGGEAVFCRILEGSATMWAVPMDIEELSPFPSRRIGDDRFDSHGRGGVHRFASRGETCGRGA